MACRIIQLSVASHSLIILVGHEYTTRDTCEAFMVGPKTRVAGGVYTGSCLGHAVEIDMYKYVPLHTQAYRAISSEIVSAYVGEA